jgi:hypothetical protein
VESGLDADDTVELSFSQRDPYCVAGDRIGIRFRYPRPARPQLRLGDVDRYQEGGRDDLGDDWVLGSQAVPYIQDGAAFRQSGCDGLDQAAYRGLGFLLPSQAFPQTEVQPPRSGAEEEIGPQAVVDGCRRVAALFEKFSKVAKILSGYAAEEGNHRPFLPPA